MELATAAMSPLLEKLGNLLVSELTLEARVRKDVASLQRELAEMHATALRRVAEVPPAQLDEGTAGAWARDVRELAYDMEDAVDAFAVRVEDPAVRGRTAAGLRRLLDRTARLFSKGKALHQVAGAVTDAKDLARELGELRQRYGKLELLPDAGSSGGVSMIDPRVMATFSEEADLVGMDSARDELIKMLSDGDGSNKDLQTVSIVGFSGLGKTTLARVVYDKIKVQFDCGAFVSISRNPDIIRIFKKILYQLDEERYVGINESVRDVDQLIGELREFLQDKRYLIVIDDLWDEPMCEFIKGVFPKNTSSCRLIMTTRIHNVSEVSCSSDSDKIYKMKPLSADDSLRLFHSRIFHRGDGCPPELEQVSRDILKKCGGVPLAIVTTASLLTTHRQVKPKDQWHVLLNSIGHGLIDGGYVKNNMWRILSLSYYDLPSHLKLCLLYLSIFPEDFDIERDRLIWRWIAEGFVQRKNSRDTLFEIGESYFIELVNRSLIQPVAINLEGRAQACRVHDMVLDLIRYLSREENFVTVWYDGDEQITRSSHSMVARRLSIQNSTTCQATTSMSKVRSFTLFNPAIDSMPPLSEFQVLRVLDLEGCDLSKCRSHLNLKHLGDLSHLRYLGLRRTCIHELPMEVGKLQFLQTLDVRGSYGIKELPMVITGLRNLMRLRLDWDTKLPNGLRNLNSLEELTGLRVGGDDSIAVVEELGHLTGLRLLTVRWEVVDLAEALIQSFENLCKLQSLDVYFDGGCGDLMRSWAPPPCLRRLISRGPTSTLQTLPAWMTNSSALPCVTFLDIWVRHIRPVDLQSLGALPSLRGLRLRAGGRIYDGHPPVQTAVRPDAFPCARVCVFLHFATAPSTFPPGAMPWVQRLEFSFRAWDVARGKLGLNGLCMRHLPSLEVVHVELWYRKEDDPAVTDRVSAALRQAAEDHPNRIALRINKRRAGGRCRSRDQRRWKDTAHPSTRGVHGTKCQASS